MARVERERKRTKRATAGGEGGEREKEKSPREECLEAFSPVHP